MYANSAFDYDFTINTSTKAFKAHTFVLDQCSSLVRSRSKRELTLAEPMETAEALSRHCYGYLLPFLETCSWKPLEVDDVPLFGSLYRVVVKYKFHDLKKAMEDRCTESFEWGHEDCIKLGSEICKEGLGVIEGEEAHLVTLLAGNVLDLDLDKLIDGPTEIWEAFITSGGFRRQVIRERKKRIADWTAHRVATQRKRPVIEQSDPADEDSPPVQKRVKVEPCTKCGGQECRGTCEDWLV